MDTSLALLFSRGVVPRPGVQEDALRPVLLPCADTGKDPYTSLGCLGGGHLSFELKTTHGRSLALGFGRFSRIASCLASNAAHVERGNAVKSRGSLFRNKYLEGLWLWGFVPNRIRKL